jgi:adenine-specific DNA-methyltransferase
VAEFMASLAEFNGATVRILDPGAGVGILAAALVSELCNRRKRPKVISVTAVELDARLHSPLEATIAECREHCEHVGVRFESDIRRGNFLEFGAQVLSPQLSLDGEDRGQYDLVITNPPYRKLGTASVERQWLESIAVEAPNVYAAFLAVAARLLRPGGQLIAITPRSFCNGAYFRAFRTEFLQAMRFARIHSLESRSEAFAKDDVLQENVIFRAVRDGTPSKVVITAGNGTLDSPSFGRAVDYDELVWPDDEDRFIHLPVEPRGFEAALRVRALPCGLTDLDLSVSTGRVVDFRARPYLRAEPGERCAPLIYPTHFANGGIEWPRATKKPNAIRIDPATVPLLVPAGFYVLLRRFSAKEERRRLVAAVYDPTRYPNTPLLGFENHLNYFHAFGSGLAAEVAFGLAAFLSSTLVDTYFRQFSGHTQVNAADLRKLRYPDRTVLVAMGRQVAQTEWRQAEIDSIVEMAL